MYSKDLLYVIPANSKKEEVINLLKAHPYVKFVSLVGIDLAGNDTDEKIPVQIFIDEYEAFLDGRAVQTDGSSVVLTGIATLNNAKVDMPIDTSVNWFVDYNMENYDFEYDKPIGTLRIPASLIHDGKAVDSRSILKNTLSIVENRLLKLFHTKKRLSGLEHIDGAKVKKIVFTSATELEFWVKTPLDEADIPEMSASQVMQEQYWQRTRGIVRTALENCMLTLEKYGLNPEMAHKEVGGMKGHIDSDGNMAHVCEQLEIDWKYSDALQCADNELLVRILVKEIFRNNGLEVNFKAKPMIGLAGNGKHTHIGLGAIMEDGSFYNLFAPKEMTKDFMSSIGYGAMMGLLKNYEVINPFVSATNDSFNRLKPGFEAPVCIVTSLGHKPEVPSRNRTILTGLIRDIQNPKATRFELRACNPYTNTYLVIAAIYSAALEGMEYAANKSTDELLAEISKEPGEKYGYLEENRAYRAENDVFDDYKEEERNLRFGVHPSTVWENLNNFIKYEDKVHSLINHGGITQKIIDAFKGGELIRWKTELISRLIPENRNFVKNCKKIESDYISDIDIYNWKKVSDLKNYLAKDTSDNISLFTRLIEALNSKNFELASNLQIEMYNKMEDLKVLYAKYKNNIF